MARGRPLTCFAVLFCSTVILGRSANPAQSPSFAAIDQAEHGDRAKTTIQVLVIDRLERPTEN